MVEEIWKDIEGYEGLYQVSDMGRVKSFKHLKPRIMKQQYNGRGYLIVSLLSGKKKRTEKVHRIAAQAFILNPENKPQVNHKDSNRDNNELSNLEWNTQSENQVHSFKYGYGKGLKGSDHYGSKLTEADIPIIRSWLSKGWKHKRIGVLFKVHKSTISLINTGKIWAHVK